MTIERESGSTAEPARPGASTVGKAAPSEVTSALRLQILASEHQSLTASRALAWNEAFARAGMYLSTLAGATVALALVGPASPKFALLALLILPVVAFIGESTVIRLGFANMSDARYVIGLNRIRAGYLEIAPELGRFFITGTHDDAAGISRTMGASGPGVPILHIVAATPFVIGTINAVVIGVFLATVTLQLSPEIAIAIVVGVVAAVITVFIHGAAARRQIGLELSGLQPMFPSPPA